MELYMTTLPCRFFLLLFIIFTFTLLLFTEEAKKMWEKQDKTWDAEKNARNKLMEDVLNTLGEQTKTKLKGDLLCY